MKITVLSENLQKALSLVNRAVSTRNQLPILSSVLLEVREKTIYLSATDLEIGIETVVLGEIEEGGVCAAPAKLFLELANTLPAGKITLKTQEGNLVISGTRTHTVLQTAPAEEFPKLYEEKGEQVLSLEGKTMQQILKRVVFASSAEATRPALSGTLFKKIGNSFVVVATDGYRLSLDTIEATTGAGSTIVPSRLIREILALKEEASIGMYISPTQNQIIFEQQQTTFVGRLIDAEFPNYEKILPTDASTTVTIDRESLLRAVKTCAIFARETANIITLSFLKDKVVVSSKTPSLGENTVEVEAVLQGEENDIAFNAKYLLDFLSIVDTTDIRFEMTGPLNAAVFRLVGNGSYLHLIMPIRT